MQEGTDRIGWKPAPGCTAENEYDPATDLVFFSDDPETWLEDPKRTFVIFFPDDAHAPLAGEGQVRKAIVKVAVDG